MNILRHLVSFSAILLAGCSTTNDRISQHAAEYAQLPPAIQERIRRGEVVPGDTLDMVFMALGKPTQTTTDASGNGVWLYRREPVTAYNETIQSGYRRRVVFDPVKHTDDIIVEPIDTKAFPNKVPYSLRLTFRDGRLATMERAQ